MGNAAALIQQKDLSEDSVEEIADIIEQIGPAYAQYKQVILDNAIDGGAITQFQEESDFKDFLKELGFTKAHTVVIWSHYKKFYLNKANATESKPVQKETASVKQQSHDNDNDNEKDYMDAATALANAKERKKEVEAAPVVVETYDAFLTHDWGVDELERNNHSRVSKVNKILKEMNIITWFDEERMEGNIRSKMAQGIENTQVAVVFITQRYRDKINGNDNRDNCKVSLPNLKTKDIRLI